MAYGQKIDITRGHLVWTNDAIANPSLDIRAERRVGDVVPGGGGNGRPSGSRACVWTDPATDQSQALAYLALGRPLSSASGAESERLDAASAAYRVGYEDASHFNREYKRLFGLPPLRDVERLRETVR